MQHNPNVICIDASWKEVRHVKRMESNWDEAAGKA
jgi:DTW domain-containing protein YfiP